ncbi:MAG: sensor histidine kinase N-terminal domain-containing protein [Pseudomonas sp.]
MNPPATRPAPAPRPAGKLRTYLLLWTLLPIAVFMLMDTASLYRTTQAATDSAHDRLLEATARQIGDLIHVERDQLSIHVPLAMIEALEGAGGSRMYWRVLDFEGRQLAGDDALPLPGPAHETGLHARYTATVDGQTVRAVALQQPIEMSQGRGVARILVAETLEARRQQQRALLRDMLARQVLLMLLIAAVVGLVVQRGLRPLRALRRELHARPADNPAPLATSGPEELQPVIDELNALLARQHGVLAQQRRFVADASHQLRTPIAVLKTQLQTALQDEAPGPAVLADLSRTVDRMAHLANQLLNKARLEHAGESAEERPLDLGTVVREAVLELSPLIAARHLAFALDELAPVQVRGHSWLASELVSNLLANAVRHTPEGGDLGVRLESDADGARMTVWDSGPGITDDARAWLFRPFAATGEARGAGLGLAICLDIARAMQGEIELLNRRAADGRVLGLDAAVRWKRQAYSPPLP